MLYTTYLANIKNIPNDTNSLCILVTRWQPRNTINFNKYKFDILWRPNLGPSETLLTRYKSGNIQWSDYRKIYLDESKNNKVFMENLQEIIKYINKGMDVYLVCYEKDDTHCHRSILREIFDYNSIQCNELSRCSNE